MNTLIFLSFLIVYSLGKSCNFIGNEWCQNGCNWKTATLWGDCEDGFPWNGDEAIITAGGAYRIILLESVELKSLTLGNNDDNGTQFLEIADRTTLTLMSDSQISKSGILHLASVSTISGPSILNNNGTIVCNGETPKISVQLLSNSGEIFVRSGKLRIDSDLEHYGTINVSKGEEMELNGQNTFIDGKLYVGVDSLLANPLIVRGDVTFGDMALFLVDVYGTLESEYSHMEVFGNVILGGTIKVKIMPKFAPKKNIQIPFLRSRVPLQGTINPELDVEDWTYPYCIRCQIVQREKLVGFECNACPDESVELTTPQYSSWRLPDGKMMSVKYLIPGLAVIFMIIVVIMGFVELWARLMQRREGIPYHTQEIL